MQHFQPRTVSAILALPLEHGASAYSAVPGSGAFNWESHAVANSVQTAMLQLLPPKSVPRSSEQQFVFTMHEILELSASLRSKEAGYNGGAALPQVYLDCTSGVAASIVLWKTSDLSAQQRTPRAVTEVLLHDIQELVPSESSSLQRAQPLLSHMTLAFAGQVAQQAHRMLVDSHTCK